MKVLLPGQVATFYYCSPTLMNGEKRQWMTGLPVRGQYVDIPDYFVQRTRGKPVNDVIHAKLCSYDGRKSSVAYCGWGGYRYAEYLESDLAKDNAAIRGVEYTAPTDPKEFHCEGYYYCVTVRWNRCQIYPTVVYWVPEIQVTLYTPPENYKGEYFSRTMYATCRAWTDTSKFPITRISYDGKVRGALLLGPMIQVFKDLEVVANTANAFSSYEEANAFALSESLSAIRSCDVSHVVHEIRRVGYVSGSLYTRPMNDWHRPDRNLKDCFLLHETDFLDRSPYKPMVTVDTNESFYWKEYLLQHAVRDACDNLPSLNDNSIQNILELVGFIKALVVDKKVEIPRNLQSAWLSYRYNFNTTKMDLEDALQFVKRNVDLGGWEKSLRAHGKCHKHIYDTDVTATCSFQIAPKNLSLLKRIWRALDTYGLTPDFYVVWDSIPYSFIVDWFLPVGDMLSTKDVSTMRLSGEYYEITNVSYSLKYIRRYPDGDVSCYARWSGSLPSDLNPLYWFDCNTPSDTTLTQRVLDAGSIFIGKA